jgi:hypothetical protein
MRKEREEFSSKRKEPRAKRAYQAPRLIEYGSVAKLTAGGGTVISTDIKTSRMPKPA